MEEGSFSSLKPLTEASHSNDECINIHEVNYDDQSMNRSIENEEHVIDTDNRSTDDHANYGDDYFNYGDDYDIEGVSVVSIGETDKRKCVTNQVLTFTDDSSKVIDFILVYDASKDDDDKIDMRKYYEDNLNGFGIVMENELTHKDCFVKLHCTFEALCKGAELMKLKKPIKKKSVELKDQQGCFQCCHKNEKLKLQVHQPFTLRNSSQFQGVENEKDFFTDGERNYILYSLLEKVVFKSKNGVFHTGLGSLLGKNVYKAAYPLHNPLPDQPSKNIDSMNEREILTRQWSHFKNLFRPQPLNKIKNYFGEQFTFYFAWMGLYTSMLFFASLAGLACFIYGLTTLRFPDVFTSDICDDSKAPGNFTICPKCDVYCDYSILSDACEYTKFTRVFDNEATIAIAIFICAWAVCFMEFWKRKQLYLQHIWNVVDFETDEAIRPQYYNQADTSQTNPLSGIKEPVVSLFCKGLRLCTSLSLILFLLITVLAAIFSVIVYRLAVVYALYQQSNGIIRKQAKLITTFTAAILNVISISILSLVYRLLAKVLTDLEAHKTRTSYEDSFIFKMVVFQFINNYGSIIYIAFFKGSFVDRPGENSLFVFNKYRQDECNEAGCFSELTIQLIIIMIGKQILNAVLELSIPIAKKCFRSRDNKDKDQYKQWEKDLDLEAHPNISMMGEYLEMVIQYGFVVMFVAAFPIAPLFAFINNIFEIRLDAHKMIKLFRRPPSLKSQDIGAWQACIKAFSYVAVITNAFIIAWTSDLIPKMVYKWNNNKSLDGYVEWSLSIFNVSDFDSSIPLVNGITECRYRSYSIPSAQVDDQFLPFYWQVLCARWAFVIVFEHLCFVLMSLTRLIPDESEEVKLRSRCEKALTDNINLSTLFDRSMQTIAFTNLASTFLNGVDMFDDAVQ